MIVVDLRPLNHDAQAFRVLPPVLDIEGHQFGAAEHAREAERQQCSVALSRQGGGRASQQHP